MRQEARSGDLACSVNEAGEVVFRGVIHRAPSYTLVMFEADGYALCTTVEEAAALVYPGQLEIVRASPPLGAIEYERARAHFASVCGTRTSPCLVDRMLARSGAACHHFGAGQMQLVQIITATFRKHGAAGGTRLGSCYRNLVLHWMTV